MAAGCVGYFVQITGRRVVYFDRNGAQWRQSCGAFPAPASQNGHNMSSGQFESQRTATLLISTLALVSFTRRTPADDGRHSL